MKKFYNEKELKDLIEFSNDLCDQMADLFCRIMKLKLDLQMERENKLSFRIKSKFNSYKKRFFGKKSIKLSFEPEEMSFMHVYRNGICQAVGYDYTIKGKKLIFSSTIDQDDFIRIEALSKDENVGIITYNLNG